MKSKWIIVILVVIIAAGGLYVYRNNDHIDTAVTIKNNTNEHLQAVGLATDTKAIMNKTNGESFYFPKQLTEEWKKACIVAVDQKGRSLTSKTIDIKNQNNIAITTVDKGQLIVDTKEATGKSIEPLADIELRHWNVTEEGPYVKATFKGNEPLQYTLYVLGKGGKLSLSETVHGPKEVVASWEKPHHKLDSWVVFTK